MEYCRQLELILVSGRDIGPGSLTGRPAAYAKVWISTMPGVVHESKVDREGGTNPTWNLTLTLTMQDFYVRVPGVEVVVKLYHERFEGDLLVGAVEIPIHALLDFGIKASVAFDVVPTGSLTISYSYGERGLKPEYPSFPSLPILELLPSAKLLSPQDSEEKEAKLPSPHESEEKDMFKKMLGNFESHSKTEDSFSELKEYALASLESSSKDLSAIRKEMMEFILSSRESSSEYLRVKRKEMTEYILSSLESSLQEYLRGMNDVAKSDRCERFLEDFTLFCAVFPRDYEFTKDVLVWQWMARRWMKWEEDEEMEEVYTEKCVDTLMDMNYIKPSGYDYVLDQTKYKIGDEITTVLRIQQSPKVGKYLDKEQSHHDPSKIELLSLTCKEIDHAVLKQYSRLHTLVIHDCYEVDHLPSDLFSEVKALKILILSRTNIVELPKSVENLKELLFLDMSETPIVWLPEIVHCFTQLQTLKLDGCLQLKGLPEGTSNLINLRHLILDVVRQLGSMPIGLGKLSNLRTLSAFLVGEEEGCSVAELKNMNKLRGTFHLLNLENVETVEEASEACLCEKVDLKKIELQWSDIEDDETGAQEGILQSLQPPVGIQELKILFYSGRMLPTWICDPSFKELVTIFLYKCKYFISLPSLGQLPSLKHLSIIENNVVVEIDSSFGRKRVWDHGAFLKLEKLTFESMSRLKKWTGLYEFDFPSLQHLIIEYCPEFVGLPLLWHLDSLSHLEIRYCPKLSFSAHDSFPPSLQSLMIKESPRLKKWCCNRNCSKIARVPTVYFDHEKFTREM